MAIVDYDTYRDKLGAPYQRIYAVEQGVASVAGRLVSMLSSLPNPGGTFAAPTTAVVPSKDLAGALGQKNSSGTQRLIRVTIKSTTRGTFFLVDRLSHQGGLSGTGAGEQTTNLSTAALTRSTDGKGVMCGLEIYSALGATGTTATINYTDDSNNAAQTSQPVVIGGTNFNNVNRVIVPSLASGDAGLRAVAGVTLAATTGTAGNFGVTLFKPLLACPIHTPNKKFVFDLALGGLLNAPVIEDDMCLHWMAMSETTSTGSQNIEYIIVEE